MALPLLVPLIAGGISAVGNALGGYLSSKAQNKAQDRLEQSQAENKAWYERRYNEDATQRADAQRMIQYTRDALKSRNRQIDAQQTVLGLTDEAVAGQRQQNGQVLADTASRVTAVAEGEKSAIEQMYRGKRDAIQQQLGQFDIERARRIGQAVQGASNVAGSIVNAFGNVPTTTPKP